VDHGKTSLVMALTGVETDTLAEEIERGLTINLGYAYLDGGAASADVAGSIGFIDVPGHRRFINTMISGVSGIDLALLVVAADDGPMPQTLEHIDVLDILGVKQLAVVISKIDQVEPARVNNVQEQLAALLSERRWSTPLMFPVSSRTGDGVAAVKEHLLTLSSGTQRMVADSGFRLSIDRRFNLNGVGLVTTGTASAGGVKRGDRLQLLPLGRELRVRQLRANNREVESATAGQRVALGLSGKITRDEIQRGDWLVSAGGPGAHERLDARLRLLASAPFDLKHMAPVKIYLGAKRVAARVAIVSGATGSLQRGCSCLVQLIMEAPVSAVWGDRFLIRDQAEDLILGGGQVLDPEAPRYGKSRPDRLDWLAALELPDPEQALNALLQADRAVNLTGFWRIRHHPDGATATGLPEHVRVFDREGNRWAVREALWLSLAACLQQHIDQWHRDHPQAPGIKMLDLQGRLDPGADQNLAMAVLESLLRNGQLTLRDGHISRKGFQPAKSQQALAHWQQLRGYLQQVGQSLPLLSELVAANRMSDQDVREALRVGLGQGELHRLNDHRYALPEQLAAYYQHLAEAHAAGEDISIGNMKKRFDTGRNLTVEVLEYFDALRLTRRDGNTRSLLGRANVQQILGVGP
jgi:selenocysteine-specific elongation factor